MLVVRATKKLLDRIGTPKLQPDEESTTWLGQWYATALFWRPQVALLVNESTLLPVLMPLAPAATLPARAGGHIAEVLAVHNVPRQLVADEVERMREYRVASTANRSVVGIMVEFTHSPTPTATPTRISSISRHGWPGRRAARCTAATSARTANSPPSSGTLAAPRDDPERAFARSVFAEVIASGRRHGRTPSKTWLCIGARAALSDPRQIGTAPSGPLIAQRVGHGCAPSSV